MIDNSVPELRQAASRVYTLFAPKTSQFARSRSCCAEGLTASRAQQEWIEEIINRPPKPRERCPIDTFNFRPRRELAELRPRHLVFVEELAIRENYDRSEAHDWLMANYSRLFGHLRFRKANEVPSKMVMISRLLDMVETRRLEIEEDRERWARWRKGERPRGNSASSPAAVPLTEICEVMPSILNFGQLSRVSGGCAPSRSGAYCQALTISSLRP